MADPVGDEMDWRPKRLPSWNPEGFWRTLTKRVDGWPVARLVGRRRAKLMRQQFAKEASRVR